MASHDSSVSIPESALPTPLFGYEHRDDALVITMTNEAFKTTFGTVDPATPLVEWLAACGVDAPTATDIVSSLADDSSVDTHLRLQPADASTTRYRLRSLDSESVGQYCLLIEQQPATTVAADRLASVISHDLRNPLDVANVHLHEARKTGHAEHFDHLEAAHERMERIIGDVLTLTRGEDALNLASNVDIESVASDAWTTVDTETADLTVDEGVPMTSADRDRLMRLFENLFRNSVEHARPDAEEPISVRVGPVDSGFYVADDGIGVSAADRERVFDPGYTTATTSAGTGLGLTIVAEIADAHDWTVTLTDSAEGGARFEFRPSGGKS